jgi:hypothetical protein
MPADVGIGLVYIDLSHRRSQTANMKLVPLDLKP